ncbi:MAG: DUF2207 domain-containing protein [Prevotella sp.]|nr:DUF2207 domain-containing protein [Prevotella sp.]
MKERNVWQACLRRLLSIFIFVMPLGAWADSVLDSLYVVVWLKPNGDAEFTEKRVMHVDDEGTEGYTVVSNLMEDSHIKEFKLFDDHSEHYYTHVPDWDALHTRNEKALKCGVVESEPGTFCICWGLGQTGVREYWVNYTITNVVRSYADYDALYHQFVAPGMDPLPRFMEVIISQGEEKDFPKGSVKAWKQGYKGELYVRDHSVVAKKYSPFDSKEYVTLLCRIGKGIIQPTLSTDAKFSELLDDFNSVGKIDKGTSSKKKKGRNIGLLIVGGILLWLVLTAVLLYAVKQWRKN